MWEGRGATARRQEAEWSSGVAAVFRVRFSATPGSERTRPREGTSPRSPFAELGTAPVHSPARHRAAVWVGRGVTVTPREAEWSSRVTPVFWGCYNQNIFKDPFGHRYYYYYYYYYYYRGALYNKDYCCLSTQVYCCISHMHCQNYI